LRIRVEDELRGNELTAASIKELLSGRPPTRLGSTILENRKTGDADQF
jgi:hypothetical protein